MSWLSMSMTLLSHELCHKRIMAHKTSRKAAKLSLVIDLCQRCDEHVPYVISSFYT
jgi:hypothetical protein